MKFKSIREHHYWWHVGSVSIEGKQDCMTFKDLDGDDLLFKGLGWRNIWVTMILLYF